MNMPGFNAETSLYKTCELYHMRSMDAIATGGTSQVVPQLPPICNQACRRCIYLHDNLSCWVCYWCFG